MSHELRDELTDIKGIGEKKADAILDVLSGYDSSEHPYVQKARDAAERGEYREAGIYLRRSGDE
jgi:ribosomal protein S13